jgi:hypothetical protein
VTPARQRDFVGEGIFDLAYVCVMDKQTGEFEVGREMTLR